MCFANEFLDALPIRQFVRTDAGWHERLVGSGADGKLCWLLSKQPLPPSAFAVGEGVVVETSPSREAFAAELARRLGEQSGLAYLIDYGSERLRGETLQAVSRHRSVDPLSEPGNVDLSSHVDFGAIARAASAAGARVYGPLRKGAGSFGSGSRRAWHGFSIAPA